MPNWKVSDSSSIQMEDMIIEIAFFSTLNILFLCRVYNFLFIAFFCLVIYKGKLIISEDVNTSITFINIEIHLQVVIIGIYKYYSYTLVRYENFRTV